MKIETLLQKKYPESSDMHHKVSSTRICMAYNDMVQNLFSELNFSHAKHIKVNTLTVGVTCHAEASQIKLYEYDVLEELNSQIEEDDYQVHRLRIDIDS